MSLGDIKMSTHLICLVHNLFDNVSVFLQVIYHLKAWYYVTFFWRITTLHVYHKAHAVADGDENKNDDDDNDDDDDDENSLTIDTLIF